MSAGAPGPLPLPPRDDVAQSLTSTVSVQYEPKTAAFRTYLTFYAVSTAAFGLLFAAVSSVLLPLHVQQLTFAHIFTGADASVDLAALERLRERVTAGATDPTANQDRLLGLLAQYNAAKASGLSIVTSVGVAVTMLIQPIIGMLSDRTRSRFGRRSPYILAGAVAGALLVALLPIAPVLAVLVVLWSVAQLAVNSSLSPLGATVADRVPDNRIGVVSAVTGAVGYLAGIGGAVLAGQLFAKIGLNAYFPLAIAVLVAAVLFVLFVRDKSSANIQIVERLTIRTFLLSFVTGLRDRDYRWAWISKVILWCGSGITTVYSIYMLQSYITPAMSATEAAQTAPLISLIGLPGTLIAMGVCGKWSDKIGRRKPFVIGASLVMAVSFLVPLALPTLLGLIVQAIVVGIGLGCFLVVDQALFIDVLPDRAAAGRDLGLATLAQNLGAAIGPVVAGVVVAIAGGNYGPIWPVACGLVLMAALAVIPIKRVR